MGAWMDGACCAFGITKVPLAPALVAQLHADVWQGKAVTSALSGAQPSQKAAPWPGEGQAAVAWWKMVSHDLQKC